MNEKDIKTEDNAKRYDLEEEECGEKERKIFDLLDTLAQCAQDILKLSNEIVEDIEDSESEDATIARLKFMHKMLSIDIIIEVQCSLYTMNRLTPKEMKESLIEEFDSIENARRIIYLEAMKQML